MLDLMHVYAGTISDLSFQLGNAVPPGIFVKSKTGQMSGRFDKVGKVAFKLYVVDAGGVRQIYRNYSFDVETPPTFAVKDNAATQYFAGQCILFVLCPPPYMQ